MDYLTQTNSNLALAARLENGDTPSIITSDSSVPISEMLVSPSTVSPPASEVASKLSSEQRSEKGSEPRRKRKHASSTTAGGTTCLEGCRKSSRAAAKKVKETQELFSPGDQGVQMSYTPASSSSPGDSLSDRKVPSSSVDNVYEFTEQEEGHRPGDEVLLKRKRNSRNYGKPKNRWLLETELKNINDSRRRTLNDPVTGLEIDTPDSQQGEGQESGGGGSAPGLEGHSGGPAMAVGAAPSGLKLRICRSAQSGAYECHLVEKRESRAPALHNSPQQFHTARGDCFRIGDVVWAKLVGWPWWPARLQAFCTDSAGQAQVKWFNWDQISFVHCEKLHHFVAAFNSKVDKRRKATAYKLAIEQAWKLASDLKDGRYDDDDAAAAAAAAAGLYDSAADDESSSSDEDDRSACAQSHAKSRRKAPLPNINRRPDAPADKASIHASLPSQLMPAFPPASSTPEQQAPPPPPPPPLQPLPQEPPPMTSVFSTTSVETEQVRKPAFSTPTTAPSLTASQAFNSFDLFDTAGVDDAFDAFAEEAAGRSTDIVSLGPLPDIGPNLNLINSSNMYSFIPSFSDDDEMDTRPVLDPASIDSIMT